MIRKFMYVCQYCYWDTSNIKFAFAKESELDNIIFQLKESYVKGSLKKMYDHVMNKLKENEGLVDRNIYYFYFL